MKIPSCTVLMSAAFAVLASAQSPTTMSVSAPAPAWGGAASPYGRWKNGLPADKNYFPIAVWLQSPRNAERFKAAGINLYVALWSGPTTNQLAELQKASMPVICSQNRLGLASKDNPIIVGWMHGDEPDNAQELPGRSGYGPPIVPEKIVRDYERIRAADPTRPVMLNLGQGVAWDNYIGRGVRRNHPEDYPEYIKGCDIASFDIYPVVHDSQEIAGKLEYVARGVDRLVQWAGGDRIVWNCIECTHISEANKKATPAQVRSEVWMALIHGSRGLIYFVHQFKPTFKEAALLDDPEMLAGVTSVNQQIQSLAPVLNSRSIRTGVTVTTSPAAGSSGAPAPEADQPIAWMQKRDQQKVYLFTVNMRNAAAHARIQLSDAPANATAKVLGESRQIPVSNRAWVDEFKPYEVHLYSIQAQ